MPVSAGVNGTDSVAGDLKDAKTRSGHSQRIAFRRQAWHDGLVSSHFFFLCLQLIQRLRDLKILRLTSGAVTSVVSIGSPYIPS